MTNVPSFSGLQTSLRALLAQQRAIDTTGHNIANANTVGYTRQEAVLSAATPLTLPAGLQQSGTGAQLGQGVDVLSFRRMRDMFGDLQYRAQTMAYGQQNTSAQALGAAEDLLNEPSDTGINAQFGAFYDAWAKLALNPQSPAAQNAVLASAQTLTNSISTLSQSLTSLQGAAAQQLTSLTSAQGPVQANLTEIARLNQGIKDAISAGQQPNDMLDRRDQLLDELSAYGQVSTTDLGNGSFNLSLDGQAVIADTTFTWPASYTATNGQLGALATLAGATGPFATYLTGLDGIASQLAAGVNAISPGFFTGTTAATLTVAGSIAAGPGGAGDGSVAQAVANLRNSAGDANTLYAQLVRRMGADSAEADRAATTAKTLQSAAQDRRQAVNGVSMDEDMTNLVKFQRGYQAASRAFSTMDEMLDTLINRTGRVGL
jgi:flagellar hook-associated protein 1 FlgK